MAEGATKLCRSLCLCVSYHPCVRVRFVWAQANDTWCCHNVLPHGAGPALPGGAGHVVLVAAVCVCHTLCVTLSIRLSLRDSLCRILCQPGLWEVEILRVEEGDMVERIPPITLEVPHVLIHTQQRPPFVPSCTLLCPLVTSCVQTICCPHPTPHLHFPSAAPHHSITISLALATSINPYPDSLSFL